MKRHIFSATIMLAMILVSCQQEDLREERPDTFKTVNLKVEIDQGSGIEVGDIRATAVDQVEGEDRVNDLYLLFFEKTTDNSGLFKGYHKVDGPVQLNTNLALDYKGINTGDYSILAFANVEGYFIDSPSLGANALTQFLGSLDGKKEMEVTMNTQIYSSVINEGYDTQLISKDNLVMSGRAVKTESEQLITLKLTRGVARYDIKLSDTDYELKTVSIWNNAVSSMLCPASCNIDFKPDVNPGRFYGITIPAGENDHKGGLYTYENYVTSPAYGDKVTTCLIVGLQPAGGGDTGYYRININPEEFGQSLKRNYVYQVTIRSVVGTGAIDEDAAYHSTVDPNLIIDINNWGLDEEGLILTDGVNTLAIPSKTIRFAQDGGTREYTIFTQGEMTLTMSPNLPSGFTARLSGNTLTVTAAPLGGLAKREGTIEIAFGGLKGTVQVLQVPKEDNFLKLEKPTITGFPAARGAGDPFKGTALVSSSKAWEAKIYNTGASSFSFDPNDLTVNTASGESGDSLEIYATLDNMVTKLLTGFVLVTLKDTPGYSRVIMLKQDGATAIDIDFGTEEVLVFEPNGAPTGIMGSISGDGYVFQVSAGENSNGDPNIWSAILDGGNSALFDYTITDNTVTVFPKGTNAAAYPHYNLTTDVIDGAKLAVYMGTDYLAVKDNILMCKTIDLSQKGVVLQTSNVSISNKGEEKGISVTVSNGFNWTLALAENSDYSSTPRFGNIDHKGYVKNGVDSIVLPGNVTFTNAATLKVGFNKIYFPLVGERPKMTMQVALAENPTIVRTIDVEQEALVPKDVQVGNIFGNFDYGMINNTYLDGFSDYLKNTSFFGPSSTYCYANVYVSTTDNIGDNLDPYNLVIPDNVTYLHAGSCKNGNYSDRSGYWNANTFSVINQWKEENKEAMIFYVHDSRTGQNNTVFWDYYPFDGSVYQEASLSTANLTSILTTDLTSNLLNYLMNDGPFGVVNSTAIDGIGTIDVAHSTLLKESFEAAGGIAIITKGSTYTNEVLLGINPKTNIIFLGEPQLMDNGFTTTMTGTTTTIQQNRFLGNFVSYVIRATQYGSHFTDLFVEELGIPYTLNALNVIEPYIP